MIYEQLVHDYQNSIGVFTTYLYLWEANIGYKN